MPDDKALAQYLRARREATRPREVGLPDSGRRRTPGLRREEVATLAGVSVDYLVRLEQGRDVHPSAEVLNALAEALRLSEDERRHLHKLAMIETSASMCPAAAPLDHEVPPTVVALLEALEPLPAYVVGPAADVLAWNAAWSAVVGPLGMLDAGEGAARPNLARYVFTHPLARAVHAHWRAQADEQVSDLRRAALRWGGDEAFATLLARLQAEPEFARRWSAHPVGEKRRGSQLLVHPGAGELALAYEVLLLPGDAEHRLVTWLPADAGTERSVRALTAGAPARLRVVGEP